MLQPGARRRADHPGSLSLAVVLGTRSGGRRGIRWSTSGLLAVVVGISLNYLWLPMRAAQYPPINEGEPVGFFSQALKDVLNRVQYGKPPLTERQASFGGQLGQLLAVLLLAVRPRLGPALRRGHGVFTVLGLSGWALWKSDRRAGLAGVALLGTLSLGLSTASSTSPSRTGNPQRAREDLDAVLQLEQPP